MQGNRRSKLLFEQALMGGGVVKLQKVLMSLLELQRCLRQGKLIVIQAPLDIKMCLHEVLIAFALRADNRLMLNLQPFTDRLEGARGEGPATIRDQGHGGAIAQTGGIEHGQRYPTRCLFHKSCASRFEPPKRVKWSVRSRHVTMFLPYDKDLDHARTYRASGVPDS